MHRFASIVATISMAFCFSPANAGNFQYISPRPGSSRLSRRTNIILRPGLLIDRSTVHRNTQFIVNGSISGRHAGTLLLSDDSKTLVFNPDQPFTSGESVTVTLNGGIRTVSGSEVEPTEFSFTITTSDPALADRFHDMNEFDPGHRTVTNGTPNTGRSIHTLSVLDSLPPDFPVITLLDSQNPTPGGIFLSSIVFDTSIHITNYLMILNNDGYPLSYHALNTPSHDFILQPNGMFTYYLTNNRLFVEADTTYATAGVFTAGNGYRTDPHELRLLPNGHAILIGLDYQAVRMDTIVPGGDSAAIVIGNTIQELDRAQNVVFQWRSWDNFNITDAVHENLTAHSIDYVHMNAIDIDTDGNLLLSSRHQDEITKIDRQTGNIIWRLGGRHNQFTFTNDTLGFSYQHAVRRIPNGHITMFDNGNYHTPPFSRAVEYELDETNRTATLVWQYRNSPDLFGAAMGYVQRLDNGNTLIGWGATNPSVTEVRPDGSKALELTLPTGVFSYRAIRFPWPNGTQTGVTTQPLPVAYSLAQNYPNPFNPTTTIHFSLGGSGHVSLIVYDLLGRPVATLVDGNLPAGDHVKQWNANGLASGMYIYRLDAGGIVQTRKLMLLR